VGISFKLICMSFKPTSMTAYMPSLHVSEIAFTFDYIIFKKNKIKKRVHIILLNSDCSKGTLIFLPCGTCYI